MVFCSVNSSGLSQTAPDIPINPFQLQVPYDASKENKIYSLKFTEKAQFKVALQWIL